MKICAKCKTEYPDDMAFCSYCGTPLQSKPQDNVCPSCGKVVHADNLRFCPYCGYSFTSSETNKSNISNKLNTEEETLKPTTANKPLQIKPQENVCPGCGKELHAKNLHSCPYCNYKFDSSEATKSGINKPNTTNLKKSYSNDSENKSVIPPNNSDNYSTNHVAQSEQYTNNENNNSFFSPKGRRGRLNYFFVNIFLTIVFFGCLFIVASIFRNAAKTAVMVTDFVYIVFVYLLFCNEAKRFHDLDKSALWAVAFIIVPGLVTGINPMLGLIAIVISSLYPLFAKGTSGPNQYGDEPN